MEGVVGEENIAELFKTSYEDLYNSAGSSEEMLRLISELNRNICAADKVEVEKINGAIVKEAVQRLKSKKNDVSESYVSDAFKAALDLLFKQLAVVFKSWMYHGTVTKNLLSCSFMPLIKSTTKKLSSYRTIAIAIAFGGTC